MFTSVFYLVLYILCNTFLYDHKEFREKRKPNQKLKFKLDTIYKIKIKIKKRTLSIQKECTQMTCKYQTECSFYSIVILKGTEKYHM